MRRIDVACRACATKEEIIIGSLEEIPACNNTVAKSEPSQWVEGHHQANVEVCGGEREIYWDDKGPGFRISGLTKRF